MRPSRLIWGTWSTAAAILWAGLIGLAAWLLPLAAAGRAAQAVPAPAPPSDAAPVADLSTRFRFIERYSVEGEKPRPEVIGQYRVAIRETNKRVLERPQEAPERSEITFQTIYIERPARSPTCAT